MKYPTLFLIWLFMAKEFKNKSKLFRIRIREQKSALKNMNNALSWHLKLFSYPTISKMPFSFLQLMRFFVLLELYVANVIKLHGIWRLCILLWSKILRILTANYWLIFEKYSYIKTCWTSKYHSFHDRNISYVFWFK